MASASALKADSALQIQISSIYMLLKASKKDLNSLVMVILPSQYVDMECYSSSEGERLEYMREHLRREISDFFTLHLEVGDAVGTS